MVENMMHWELKFDPCKSVTEREKRKLEGNFVFGVLGFEE